MSVRFVFSSILILMTTAGFAQEQFEFDFLKRTSVAIHKAQKQMLVAGKNDAGGKLAKAVLFQSYAVKLFNEKKQNESFCCSFLSRQIANEILKDVTGKEATFFLITDAEKKQAAVCKDEATTFSLAKKELPQLSADDKDFMQPGSLNASNIDPK